MSESQPSQVSGRLFLCMIGLMLILVGGVFGWLMLRSYLHAKASRDWPQVEAVVLRSSIAERQIKGSPPEYKLDILYGYTYGGEDLESGKLSPRGTKWTKNQDLVVELASEYPVGSRHTAWVSPGDLHGAILKHDTKAAGYTLWFPTLFVVAGAGMVWGALRRVK